MKKFLILSIMAVLLMSAGSAFAGTDFLFDAISDKNRIVRVEPNKVGLIDLDLDLTLLVGETITLSASDNFGANVDTSIITVNTTTLTGKNLTVIETNPKSNKITIKFATTPIDNTPIFFEIKVESKTTPVTNKNDSLAINITPQGEEFRQKTQKVSGVDYPTLESESGKAIPFVFTPTPFTLSGIEANPLSAEIMFDMYIGDSLKLDTKKLFIDNIDGTKTTTFADTFKDSLPTATADIGVLSTNFELDPIVGYRFKSGVKSGIEEGFTLDISSAMVITTIPATVDILDMPVTINPKEIITAISPNTYNFVLSDDSSATRTETKTFTITLADIPAITDEILDSIISITPTWTNIPLGSGLTMNAVLDDITDEIDITATVSTEHDFTNVANYTPSLSLVITYKTKDGITGNRTVTLTNNFAVQVKGNETYNGSASPSSLPNLLIGASPTSVTFTWYKGTTLDSSIVTELEGLAPAEIGVTSGTGNTYLISGISTTTKTLVFNGMKGTTKVASVSLTVTVVAGNDFTFVSVSHPNDQIKLGRGASDTVKYEIYNVSDGPGGSPVGDLTLSFGTSNYVTLTELPRQNDDIYRVNVQAGQTEGSGQVTVYATGNGKSGSTQLSVEVKKGAEEQATATFPKTPNDVLKLLGTAVGDLRGNLTTRSGDKVYINTSAIKSENGFIKTTISYDVYSVIPMPIFTARASTAGSTIWVSYPVSADLSKNYYFMSKLRDNDIAKYRPVKISEWLEPMNFNNQTSVSNFLSNNVNDGDWALDIQYVSGDKAQLKSATMYVAVQDYIVDQANDPRGGIGNEYYDISFMNNIVVDPMIFAEATDTPHPRGNGGGGCVAIPQSLSLGLPFLSFLLYQAFKKKKK